MNEIGEIISYNGLRLTVAECSTCVGCYFETNPLECGEFDYLCTKKSRDDHKGVIFVKTEFKYGK